MRKSLRGRNWLTSACGIYVPGVEVQAKRQDRLLFGTKATWILGTE